MSEWQVGPVGGAGTLCRGVLDVRDFPRAQLAYDPYCRPLLSSRDWGTYWLAALPLMADYATAVLGATNELLAAHGDAPSPGETLGEQAANPDQLCLFCEDLDAQKDDPLTKVIVDSVLGDVARVLRRMLIRDVRELARVDRVLERQARMIQRPVDDRDWDRLVDELTSAAEYLRQGFEQAALGAEKPLRGWVRWAKRERWTNVPGEGSRYSQTLSVEIAISADESVSYGRGPASTDGQATRLPWRSQGGDRLG